MNTFSDLARANNRVSRGSALNLRSEGHPEENR